MRSERQRRVRSTIVLACVLATCTCVGTLTACTSSVASQPTTPAADLASTRVDEPTFALALSAPERVAVGAPATATLSIEGRGVYHVNHEYPLRVVLRAPPDVALTRSELGSADAAELGPARARFELPFTCRAAGAQRIEADVEFALCTEDACIPESHTIALTVQARRDAE